jgi:SAM-dependent methyltransferase
MSGVATSNAASSCTTFSAGAVALCLICGGSDHELHLQKNDFKIYRCQSCGFQFVWPMPSEKKVAEFYQRHDYYQSDGLFGYSDYESKREFYLGLFRGYLETLKRHGGHGRLLDLGCGNGDFLCLAREAGWEGYGVEISDVVRAEAERRSGAQVFASLDGISDRREFFDVITMWEFIEHLRDPHHSMRAVLALLRPGGLVALTTPNTRNLTALRCPERWLEFKPPEHLQFFDFQSVRRFFGEKYHLQVVEMKGIHRDFRLMSDAWVESILDWALQLRARHDNRSDPVWWLFAVLVRLLKEFPRRLYLAARSLDPELLDTGILFIGRK